MIWEVQKNNKQSYLIGTAHYFPYSFKTSLQRYLDLAGTVIFEGPLDQKNMDRVQAAGNTGENSVPLVENLGAQTITDIYHSLFPECRRRDPYFLYNFRTCKMENPVYDMIKGMKAWLAFFTIWFAFLERNGWKYSVDLEAFNLADALGKKIIYLETIEEQIKVLESLSHERIINFLSLVKSWDTYMKDYIKSYLNGDVENLRLIARGYPNRTPTVIDRIFPSVSFQICEPYRKKCQPGLHAPDQIIHRVFRFTGTEVIKKIGITAAAFRKKGMIDIGDGLGAQVFHQGNLVGACISCSLNLVHAILIQRAFKYDGAGVSQAALKRGFETIREKVSGADKIRSFMAF